MSDAPIKKFSDDPGAERRGGPDDELRRFAYFKPAKRRATQYEDVTVDTQPSIHRHISSGSWALNFEDGRGTWSDDSTKLKSTDWYEFRDPAQLWERTYYQQGARLEAGIDAAVKAAAVDGLFEEVDPDWIAFCRDHLLVPAFVDKGIWLATASIGRDVLSDVLTHAIVFQAGMKQRLAQSYVLYGMDLEEHWGEFPMSDAKERWLSDPAWQPVRAYVERLHSITDWGEVIVAANLVFEPLVGSFVRRELLMRAASLHGDSVTPTIARAGQVEAQWVTDWTSAMIRMVLDDAEHAAHNREVLDGWIAEWEPQAQLALEELEVIAAGLGRGFDAGDARARVQHDTATLLDGLLSPAGASA